MHFHFQMANHFYGGLYVIEDIVLPMIHGLRAMGHRVTTGILPDLPPWPSVVMLLEYFDQKNVIDDFVLWRTQKGGPRSCVGLVCTEDIDDKLVMEHPEHPDRRRFLLQALPHCDFVWPIVPCDYGRYVPAERLAFLEYGYVEALRRDGLPAGQRTIDVLLYGSVNERRRKIMDELKRRGLTVAATRGFLPDYMRDNLIGRAKVVLDIKRGDDVKYTSPSRICTALQMGATLVSERFDTSSLASLYQYTSACDFTEIADRCEALARSPDPLAFGLEARERFKAGTSMTANLKRVMQLPVFDELAKTIAERVIT